MPHPLPVHPRTGLTALGVGKRGPIWPVMGGSEDHDAGGDTGGDADGGKGDDSSDGNDTGSTDKGFPPNTRREDMTPEQQAAYWKYHARKNEDALKKLGNVNELKAAAAELEQIKQARKTEAEKLKERAEKAEKAAADALAEVLRSKVASRKGIPADMADVLKGSTEEEMEAHADSILPYIKTTGSGTGNGNGTTRRVADVDQGAGGGQPPKATEASGRAAYAERHKQTPPTFS